VAFVALETLLVAPEAAGVCWLLQPVRSTAPAIEINIKDAFIIRLKKQYFANSDGDLQIDF
jgi:hypothetical protein